MAPRRAYAIAIAAVVAATLAGVLLEPVFSTADQTMVYLLAILIAALGGRGPGIAAAALSVAAFDFFCVLPRYTFVVADPRSLVTFAVMFATGAAIGTLVARLRRAEAATHERELRVRAEEVRSSLLAAVSHDLRTPLAVITGVATELRDRTPESAREPLDTIVDEAERLSRILTNLLAITRVESGGAPRREWVPFEELVGTALDRLAGSLADHPVAVDVPADAIAHVDPILVELLLINLLENAAKHTPPGTPIEIHGARATSAAVLEVTDRGPGLPAGPPTQMFAKGFRGPDTHASGVGLGLAVCRGIALAHGGTIEAEARDGGGATFRARFPDDGHPPALADGGEPPSEARALTARREKARGGEPPSEARALR